MPEVVLSVSTLIQQVKLTLDQNVYLKSFYVKGELSNFIAHHNGHWYFSLKDEQARIQCVMFQGYATQVAFKPKDGMRVLLRASLSVYPVQGQLQCSVFSMESDGIGDLYLRYEALKKRLYAEGLFDDVYKKRLPEYPHSIGVITGRNTAALQDILETFRHRWPMINLSIYESLVQGDLAPNQLIAALKKADQGQHQVLILARGGGSLEDLWAFNDEQLARTIFACQTPIVTGIGHETDTTIADMVADSRAPTPTGAVQMVVKEAREVQQRLTQTRQLLTERFMKSLTTQKHNFHQMSHHRLFKEPQWLWMRHQIALTNIQLTLLRQKGIVDTQRLKLNQLVRSLVQRQALMLQPLHEQLHNQRSQLKFQQTRFHQKHKDHLGKIIHLLQAYSPLAILSRGYSIVSQNQRVIHSIQQVEIDQKIDVKVQDGSFQALVLKKGK